MRVGADPTGAVPSLLAPGDADVAAPGNTFTLDDATLEDLGVDEIARRLTSPALSFREAQALLANPACSNRIITYRHEILGDFLESPDLVRGVEAIIPRIRELFYFSKAKQSSDSPVMEAIWRLGELELYVECVESLHTLFSAGQLLIKSEGLSGLAECMAELRNRDSFQHMKDELTRLRAGLRLRKSVTIGVNLDEKLRPVEATLVSINDQPFTGKSLLGKLFGPSQGGFASLAPIHATPTTDSGDPQDGAEIPLNPLFQDIEVLLRSLAQPLVEALKKYLRIHVSGLRALAAEFAFYLGAVRLLGELTSSGVPICRPVMLDEKTRSTGLTDFYNIQLALREPPIDSAGSARSEIILNDVTLDDHGRIGILTGPNQGGKTTFTQGIGLAHLLAQCGLYVPARSAELSPVDSIATHFPVGEKGQLKTGRLAEESERLSLLFGTITEGSLVLLNESLASTSPEESLALSEEIVKTLRFLGVRCVFATHLHVLATECDRLNSEVAGNALIISLVAGVESESKTDHRRTYRIIPGEPEGTSYARDIAKRSGIGFEELTERLRRRGLPKNTQA